MTALEATLKAQELQKLSISTTLEIRARCQEDFLCKNFNGYGIKKIQMFRMTSTEVAPNVTDFQTSSTSSTTGINDKEDEDFLFKTLHGYPVTLSHICVSIIMVILGIWIILLNCLLIHTLIKYRAHLDVTDMFIHSLAITDAILGLLVLYNSTYNIVNFQNRYECLIRFGIIQGMLINSTGHVLLLTINRYIKIIKPLVYRQIFKKRRIILLSGSVWLFSLVFGLAPLLGWNKEYSSHPDDKTHTVCRYFGVTRRNYVIVNVSLYWLPLITMIILYTHMGTIAYKHTKQIRLQERRSSIYPDARVFDSRSWKFTKTVLLIIGIYFFCWMPAGIFFMIELSGALEHHNLTELGHILTFTTSLGFLNSIFNPIIYATKIPCVQRRFRQVFCCRIKSQETNAGIFYTPRSTDEILGSTNTLNYHL